MKIYGKGLQSAMVVYRLEEEEKEDDGFNFALRFETIFRGT